MVTVLLVSDKDTSVVEEDDVDSVWCTDDDTPPPPPIDRIYSRISLFIGVDSINTQIPIKCTNIAIITVHSFIICKQRWS